MAVVSCLIFASCGKKAEPPAADEAAPVADKVVAAAKEEQESQDKKLAVDVEKGPTKEPATAAESPTFIKTQLGNESPEQKFLGWTKGGDAFVFETKHLSDSGTFRRTVVFDTLSQQAIASFQVKGKLEKRAPAEHEEAWAEAAPKEKWDEWLAANPLTLPPSSLESPDGSAKLSVKVTGMEIENFQLSKKKGNYVYKWVFWDTDIPEGLEPGEIAAMTEGTVNRPKYTVTVEKGSEKWNVLKHTSPFDDSSPQYMAMDEELAARGQLDFFWSPKGDRFIVATKHRVREHDKGERLGHGRDAFLLRTPGLQVVLKDGGAGLAAVRARADSLGVPVQGVGAIEGSIDETTVYFRGKARPLAEKVAKQLGGAKVEEIKKRGWVDVIAILAK
jgi:hypothetical protein